MERLESLEREVAEAAATGVAQASALASLASAVEALAARESVEPRPISAPVKIPLKFESVSRRRLFGGPPMGLAHVCVSRGSSEPHPKSQSEIKDARASDSPDLTTELLLKFR